MDGVIETVIRTIVEPGDKVVICTPTFSMYGLAAKAASAMVVKVPRKADFSVDLDAFLNEANMPPSLVPLHAEQSDRDRHPGQDIEYILDRIEGVLFLIVPTSSFRTSTICRFFPATI